MMAQPVSHTWRLKPSMSRDTLMPGIDSSLSSVPPVKPSPRPDILAIFTPHAATSGTRISEVVSPTPPVECLSALTPSMSERSRVSPDLAIASVSASVSRSVMPLMQIAISSADA